MYYLTGFTEEAGIQVSCLGSNIANWGIAIDTPFEETWEVVKRAADRAKKLGTSYVRIMSYAIRQGPDKEILEDQKEEERYANFLEYGRRFMKLL